MASSNLPTSLSKFGHVGATIAKRSTWNHNFFFASSPRTLQSMSHTDGAATQEKASEAVQHGVDEAIKTGENMKNKAASAAEQVTNTTEGVAGKISETAQDAWGSAKDTAQKAKDTVTGKAQDSKEAIKENAETIKRSMNSKKTDIH